MHMSSSTEKRLSRRDLLAGFAAVGAFAAVAMAAKNSRITRSSSLRGTATGTRSRPASLATAEIEHWMAEVGSDFDIAHTRMRLSGVRALAAEGTRPAELRQRPFIAVFDLPQGEALPGNLLYHIANRNYPAFDIYLSEPGDQSLHRMLAIFN
jgi:hypothetical protein